MRVDTLSYKYQMNVNRNSIYQVLHDEQERYFQSNGFLEGSLNEGAEITLSMPSKLGTTRIPASIHLSKLNEHEIELTTTHNKGVIIQSYVMDELSYSKTQITYSEKNSFNQLRNQYSFIFLALLYKLFYNRGVKKRMLYLEKQCHEKEASAK